MTEISFALMQMRARILYSYMSETYESFRYWNTIPASLHFLFILMQRKRSKRKGSRPVTPA